MRADLSTIQQTLSAEAATILSRSIDEAARRRHGQTTPLHVASALLSYPSGLLRRACSSSPHPLQSRALELCFSVALDRLPSSASSASPPPVSNALMAALKRAQAHQRRGGAGCPETPQPPLLAVKVELDQLVLSILDDPSVSRVMREASFNSADVKSTIENSLIQPNTPPLPPPTTPTVQNPIANRNVYLNPRLVAPVSDGLKRDEEIKKLFDVMSRSSKRNPILVGDSDTDSILRDAVQKIQSGAAPPPISTAQVISLDPDLSKITGLSEKIEERIPNSWNCASIVVNLGDLKVLVENPGSPAGRGLPAVTEARRAAVVEVARILKRFGSEGKRVWLVGNATCATYLRCQVYHSGMETEWDLQAVPVAARRPSPNPTLFPHRLGGNGILGNNALNTISPMKGLGPALSPAVIPLRRAQPMMSAMADPTMRAVSMCQLCMAGYEREMAKLVAEQTEKSATKPSADVALPHWLKLGNKPAPVDNLAQPKEQELMWKKSTEELQRKWRETCSRLHPDNPSPALPPALVSCPQIEPKLTLSTMGLTAAGLKTPSLKLTTNLEKPSLAIPSPEKPKNPPVSLVKTDLVLGGPTLTESLSDQQKAKIAGISDIDSFKKLLKGLKEKVSWQPDAASTVAAAVIQCKAGNGKQRGVGTRGDTWLLFIGADRIGKRKMADALSELMFGGAPVFVRFGLDDRGSKGPNMDLWGKTTLDRVVEAVRINPFSVVVLEDVDKVDTIVRGKIKHAIDRGRLPDSHGREVSLGSVIFILTSDWIPEEVNSNPKRETLIRSEERILWAANSCWQLELSVGLGDEATKHRADWLCDDDRPTKVRKDLGLSLDLNLAVGSGDDMGEGSRNSSDLTVEHESERGRLAIKCLMPSPAMELLDSVNDAVIFEPVDFAPLKKKVIDCVTEKFKGVIGNRCSVKVDDEVVDRMVGGVWVVGTKIEDWAEKVLVPEIERLKRNLRFDERKVVIRLSPSVNYGRKEDRGVGLPSIVTISVDGA